MKVNTITAALLAASLPLTAHAQRAEVGASGSINVDCDSTSNASVSAVVPYAANIEAEWTDLSNVKSSYIDPIRVDGRNVSVTGGIVGRDKESVAFGIKNCPGGGHGTMKVYATPSSADTVRSK